MTKSVESKSSCAHFLANSQLIMMKFDNINDDNNNNINDDDDRIEQCSSRTVSDTCAQVPRAQLCANHLQHIERLSQTTLQCATWYRGTAQLLSFTEFKLYLCIVFTFSTIY